MARRGDGLGRWIRQSATGRWLASFLSAFYIRFVAWTTRWQIIGQEHRESVIARGTGIITVFWHGRLFMSPTWPPRGRRSVAMISNNRDGDLISAIVRRFGAFAVRGSTYDREKGRDKGGTEAYAAAHAELTQNKAFIGITPDGPRGPRMRVQRGAAMLAIQTRLPVLPITFSTVRGKTLRNWDRFLIPWPFGRGVQIYGEPIMPPLGQDEASILSLQQRIEEALTAITHQADDLCGRAQVEPGPPIGAA